MADNGGRTGSGAGIIVALVVGVLVVGFSLFSLFTEPVLSASWFAALAGIGVFGPVLGLALAMVVPKDQERNKTKSGSRALYRAIFFFGWLALALAFAAASGYIAYTVDGVESFRTGTKSWRYDLPVPVFIAMMGALSLGFGAITVIGIRDLQRQRRKLSTGLHQRSRK